MHTVPNLQLRAWNADALRRQAVELLETSASADVFFFTLSRTDAGLHYWDTMFSSDIARHMEQFEGCQVFDDSLVYRTKMRTWSVREPEPQMHNRFSTLDEDYEDVREVFATETFQKAFAPIELTGQARALVYDGERFLGCIAALRRGGGTFRPRVLASIRRQTNTIRRLLLLADRIARSGATSPLHLVCDESGRVVYADERAGAWLTRRRAETLRQLVQEQKVCSLDGMLPTYGWLDDGHRKLRYIVLSPTRAVRVTKWHHLSCTQREIVKLAFDGFSNTEIARLQGITASTVKYHLAEAAKALGVSGRSGLREVLAAEDSH